MDYIMLMEDGKIKELKTSQEFFEEIKENEQDRRLR